MHPCSRTDVRLPRSDEGLGRRMADAPKKEVDDSPRPVDTALVPHLKEPPMRVADPNRRRASSEQVLALWTEYRDTSDPAIRDRLVLTFAPLVKYIVYKKAREMP